MSDYLIDLAKWPFWAALAAAIIFVAPRTRDQHRSWVYALLNLGFITLLVGWRLGGCVLGGGIVVWFLAGLVRNSPKRGIWVALAMGITLAIFVIHKRPGWFTVLDTRQINPLLRLVGYSYIALRLIELCRAMYEQRYDAPELAATLNYLIPFQMVAAGPIQSYDDFVLQPGEPRVLNAEAAMSGAQRIAHGVFKKFVLAFAIKKLFLTDFTVHGSYWILEAQMFFIWLYLDFSAYSDIAVGIGKLIGVHTPENFNRPYFARNMIAFWERWHISLSLWIRRNLFFPVQIALLRRTDGKKPLVCASVGFVVAFLLCGMWHGIAWNFFVWGAMQASGLVIVNCYRVFLTRRLGSKGVKTYLSNPYIKAAAMALTFEWVAISHLTFFYRF
jgi:D-alanyl-lipoteichoic acid acyltransferase DltB (MBOAT superfamily)